MRLVYFLEKSLRYMRYNSNIENLLFVVHKHKATTLHYDFRLQIGDVMPSWAIPKGPSLDPKIKRLAMKTTDHSMEYRNFEGVLPERSYGAGPVIIWDEGYYIPEKEIKNGLRTEVLNFKEAQNYMAESLMKGELKFKLVGKRLNGSFSLVRTKSFGPKNSWLFIKHKDEYSKSEFNPEDFQKSIRSGKSLDEISR